MKHIHNRIISKVDVDIGGLPVVSDGIGCSTENYMVGEVRKAVHPIVTLSLYRRDEVKLNIVNNISD